jgi:hypothetical protein
LGIGVVEQKGLAEEEEEAMVVVGGNSSAETLGPAAHGGFKGGGGGTVAAGLALIIIKEGNRRNVCDSERERSCQTMAQAASCQQVDDSNPSVVL